jgi:hypothetical protein
VADYDIILAHCSKTYFETYEKIKEERMGDYNCRPNGRANTKNIEKDIETAAQKEAIKKAAIEGIRVFGDTETTTVWNIVYETHVYRKSGVDNYEIIKNVISADQSWKKSSGHAFEEMVKELASAALADDGIEIILQRDLSLLIGENRLINEHRDIEWLMEQRNASKFDLYAVFRSSTGYCCFGCIQSKTSIRDRVTRDREPSIAAMRALFWSVAVVLDGSFLQMPKFISMVNGNTSEYPVNGWHGLYVLSYPENRTDRIYSTTIGFEIFKRHAIEALNDWKQRRQWFDNTWKATDNF